MDLSIDSLVDRVSEVFKLHFDVLELIRSLVSKCGLALIKFYAESLDELLDLPETLLTLALADLNLPLDCLSHCLLTVLIVR